jgi:putative spermidine/putrescine transport system substrate-binding protein
MDVARLAAYALCVAAAAMPAAAQPPPAPPPAAPPPAAPPPARPRTLTLAMQSGEERAALQGVYVSPFANVTGIATSVEPWDGTLDSLRAKLHPPDPPGEAPPTAAEGWDVALVPAGELQAGCDEGLFEKLDWSAIGGRDHYQAAAVSDCGVGGVVRSLVLSWDRDKYPGTPSWGDFFDVAKYPGKRGLRRDPRGCLEFALLADGVAPGDVYKTLRGSDGVDRAFHKLDQLRPYIVWWQRSDEAAQLLASGEVLMTSALNGAITLANHTQHRNLGVQWSGGLTSVQAWAIVKGSPERALAAQFLYFAGMPAIQARMLPLLPYPGMAKGVNELAPPEQALASPTLPANLAAGLPVDEGFWRDNAERLGQRFSAWLSN